MVNGKDLAQSRLTRKAPCRSRPLGRSSTAHTQGTGAVCVGAGPHPRQTPAGRVGVWSSGSITPAAARAPCAGGATFLQVGGVGRRCGRDFCGSRRAVGYRGAEESGSLRLRVGVKSRGLGGSPEAREPPPNICMGDAAEGTRTRGVAAGAAASPIPPAPWSSGLSRDGGPSSDHVGGAPRKFCGGNGCIQGIPGSPCAQLHLVHGQVPVLTGLLRAAWSRCAGVAPRGTGPSPRFLTNTRLTRVLSVLGPKASQGSGSNRSQVRVSHANAGEMLAGLLKQPCSLGWAACVSQLRFQEAKKGRGS